MKQPSPFLLALASGWMGATTPSSAQTTAFTYQGQLQSAGSPANGLYEVSFALYDAVTNGHHVGTPITVAPLAASNGLLTATLDFGAGAFTGANRWLDISVTVFGSDQPVVPLVPRQKFTSTPYALQAVNAANLMSFTAAPLDIKVNGVRALRLELGGYDPDITGAPNVIGGAPVNLATPILSGITIAGGGAVDYFGRPAPNVADSDFSTIGGGMSNSIFSQGFGGTIAGGARNTILWEGTYSTIGGGYMNLTADDAGTATIAGGRENHVTGYGGTIGGGWGNTAGSYATIGGGTANTSSGRRATVSGGAENVGTGEYATIGGGRSNAGIGTGTTVAGGFYNKSTGEFATVGGGLFNRSGYLATTIGGGQENTNWSEHGSIGGGIGNLIDTNSPRSTIGGGLTNEVAANSREILNKVAALPLASWNYKAQDASIRHVGPTAQDFHAAFSLGENDHTIATVDADGIALAAIQGLNQKLEQETKRQAAEIDELKRRLAELEGLFRELGPRGR